MRQMQHRFPAFRHGAVMVVLSLATGCCVQPLLLSTFTPDERFARVSPPPRPDYSNNDAWLALPETVDEADVALPEDPAASTPLAAVFYVHSTSNVDHRWNAEDAGEVKRNSIRGGTLIQASAFNGCCAIYAPGYRQASGSAFVAPSADGEAAIALAYSDVSAAFDAFLKRKGNLPFVVVAHSQGAVLAARLLKARIADQALADELIAAYIIGAPVSEADIGLPGCHTPQQTGCAVAFNARSPQHEPQLLDFGGHSDEERRLCVNPVLGTTSTTVAPVAAHAGALFWDEAKPEVRPHFARSQCRAGRLVVDELGPLPDRGVMSSILLSAMGGTNYHPIEFQLFYLNLRKDAKIRTDEFIRNHVNKNL